jgi:hypothetical protein
VPGYTKSVQEQFERSASAQRELEELTGSREPQPVGESSASLGGLRPRARVPRHLSLAQLRAAHARGIALRLYTSEFAFGGRWTVEDERAVAGTDARLRLSYRAHDVFLVLSGTGSVDVLVDGKRERRVQVRGDRLYTLVDRVKGGEHLLDLRVGQGLAAYAFTFG